MNIEELDFEQLKEALSRATPQLLIFIMVTVTNELMDRYKKGKL